ncbi:MAG TPA: acetyl-CoA acetyltransferase [Candidatus Latescibacteria bacterium]|nr:acetyl-CoA acetyltransferase [Candidatus Latescibacterota bacterium]
MKKEGIRDRVAVIGMGCCKFGENWDKGPEDMIIEAAYEAYEDAKIDPSDIQAAWLGTTSSHWVGMGGLALAEPLKLHQIPVTRVENWCATGHEAFRNACFAVAAGMYDIVLALGFEKLKDCGFPGLGIGRGMHPVMEVRRTAPSSFAFIAHRYFHEYGLSYEEGKRTIGKIAVKNHHNGSMHPKAHFRMKVTLEQVLNAPIISSPLGLFDCCGNSDGAAAAIICSSDIAKSFRDDPIYVKGIGLSQNSIAPHFEPNFGWTGFASTQNASRQAYDQAGIKDPRKEIDVAVVHDCFTITELIIYEDLGFSPRGRAREDVDAGTFTLDGELPVNSDGGLKCFGHPIGASGLRMCYEVYKQLQGKCGERQIKKVDRGLAHTLGGHPTVSCVVILGNERG